jgi:hypothetical protein
MPPASREGCYKDSVYVTLRVSPLIKERSPPEKRPAENRIPVVPPLVLLEIRKQPLIVTVALIENVTAADVVFEPAEAAENEGAGRVASE